MKKLIYAFAIFAVTTIAVTACQKENVSPTDANHQTAISTKGEIDETSMKELNKMAQAANLASIAYDDATNKFTVQSYDDNKSYVIKVKNFAPGSIVSYVISYNDNNYRVEFDYATKSISIESFGNFTFDNYFDENGITSQSGIMKNIVAVFSPYYALLGSTSSSWGNNGNDDVFDPPAFRKFIGTETTYGPCNELLHIQSVTTHTYFFWIEIGTHTEFGQPC